MSRRGHSALGQKALATESRAAGRPMTDHVSRRNFMKIAGVGTAATAALPGAVAAQEIQTQARVDANTTVWQFFTVPEAEFVMAATARLIPADEDWGGAAEASVVNYIDRQLASPYGHGARLYLDPPWKQGTPQQGYQYPFTPAQIYRLSLAALEERVPKASNGRRFIGLEGPAQDELLKALETGRFDLGEVPGPLFFETLLTNTVEGFFADPIYGGNQDLIGWRMIGFPGPYASYIELVDRHGIAYDRQPISMAERALLHAHAE